MVLSSLNPFFFISAQPDFFSFFTLSTPAYCYFTLSIFFFCSLNPNFSFSQSQLLSLSIPIFFLCTLNPIFIAYPLNPSCSFFSSIDWSNWRTTISYRQDSLLLSQSHFFLYSNDPNIFFFINTIPAFFLSLLTWSQLFSLLSHSCYVFYYPNPIFYSANPVFLIIPIIFFLNYPIHIFA